MVGQPKWVSLKVKEVLVKIPPQKMTPKLAKLAEFINNGIFDDNQSNLNCQTQFLGGFVAGDKNVPSVFHFSSPRFGLVGLVGG